MAMRATVTTKAPAETYEGPLVRDDDDEYVVVLDDDSTGRRVTVGRGNIARMRVVSDR